MKLLLAEDWFLYVQTASGTVAMYNTELWSEWLDYPKDAPTSVMYQHINSRLPIQVMSLKEFQAGL